jgi:hypothetical protein
MQMFDVLTVVNHAARMSRIPRSFVRELQAHQTRISITASAVRSQGSGTAEIARAFLADELSLQTLRVSSESAYLRRLDSLTVALQSRLRGKARTFGLARKLLNIFIRDCVYSRLLCRVFRLEKIEPFLEVPLDGIVGKRLREAALKRGQGQRVPRWRSIRALTRAESDQYQSFASELSARRKLARVHLDVTFWGFREAR